jgi:hypothetical protein
MRKNRLVPCLLKVVKPASVLKKVLADLAPSRLQYYVSCFKAQFDLPISGVTVATLKLLAQRFRNLLMNFDKRIR